MTPVAVSPHDPWGSVKAVRAAAGKAGYIITETEDDGGLVLDITPGDGSLTGPQFHARFRRVRTKTWRWRRGWEGPVEADLRIYSLDRFIDRLTGVAAARAPLAEPEQELWHLRARRLTEHALYHMGDHEVSGELELALICLRIACSEASAEQGGELAALAFPGDEDYDCKFGAYSSPGCGYRP